MKKNQIALIFLTVITMLAVWLVKSPLLKAKTDSPLPASTETNIDTGSRLKEITEMRDALRDLRFAETASFDAVLADGNATLAAKSEAYNHKQELSDLTEKEVLMELRVINLGYEDAFVHSTSSGIEVLVVAEESSSAKASEIVNLVLQNFVKAQTVVVNFTTKQELKNSN
jgi:hypothetical protein